MNRTETTDTHPEVERLMLEGFRRMSGWEKWQRVASLNRALDTLAIARIKATYGFDIGDQELRLRLAALSVPRELMIKAFGWDPEVEGY